MWYGRCVAGITEEMASAKIASPAPAPGLAPLHGRGTEGGVCARGKGEDEAALSKKLNEINQKLARVVAERKKLSPLKPHPPHAAKGKGSTATCQQQEQLKMGKIKSPKKRLHHPNLDVLLTEISLSPYLTDPEKNYSKKTIKLPSLIRDMRDRDLQTSHSASSAASLLGEKEMSQLKKTFREVIHYKQQFDTPLSAASCSSSQSGGPGARGMKRRLPSIAKTADNPESTAPGPQPLDTTN
jgi:hypothetical protein